MELSRIVEQLGLKPHPEGVYNSEIYRSESATAVAGLGWRNFSTSIYFFLTEGNFSAFHRIRQDEI